MFFNWRFIKAFPKIALVAGVFIVSTGVFTWWWFFRSPDKVEASTKRDEARKEAIQKTAAEVEQRLGRLLLMDNELYDVDTGELFFKNWLKEGIPINLFWERDTKTFLAQYPNGFVRYGLDGAAKQTLVNRFKLPFDNSYSWALYCKDKDIWRADVDWKELKFVKEKQVTHIGQFFDQFFAENLIFGTDEVLVVRVTGKMARVDLATGEVKPVRYPLKDIDKRRSPNSKYLVGTEGNQFFCHDIDSDESKTIQVGRGAINDFQWLGNDRGVFIAGGEKVVLFDRLKNTLEEVASLPVHGDKIGEPSPDFRYVFTGSRKGLCLVDITGKKAETIAGGEGTGWVTDDTFIFSRELMDSKLRGTYMQKAGGEPTRIYDEPYLAGRGGAAVVPMKEAGIVVFVTKEGVMRMNPDGTDIKAIKKFESVSGRSVRLPSKLLGISEWKVK